uniref:Methyltransf_11 domain-containing protein n=1 Tax=Angiostrongylus cantonensis TaxID=6313 RepID=A0A0K0CTT3_ANGCA
MEDLLAPARVTRRQTGLQVSRILKPGGRFLIYDLIKTENYDEKNEVHVQIIEGLEYACGMPSLHTRAQMLEAAERFDLIFEDEEDLSETNGIPFHYCFSHSPIFMWLIESPLISKFFFTSLSDFERRDSFMIIF